MPIDTLLEDHRLVTVLHSTGGPLRKAMEQPCAIAGLKDDVPSDVKAVRAANQNLQSAVHKVGAAAMA